MIRTDLPVRSLEKEIVSTLAVQNRLIIKAPTGSGKSTQVPQFLVDNMELPGKILILQPRRLAARMLASRVAQERNGKTGDEIGFQTRFESAFSKLTKACFITEGILTRMLLGNPDLRDISAIIFDEFHERSLTSDMGLSLAADLQRTKRPDLKIIVMSATIEIESLQAYLNPVRIIQSEGRTFPVDIRYLSMPNTVPVWEQAAKAADSIVQKGLDGDILIFMPGVYEIRRTVDAIDSTVRGESVQAFALYGDLPADKQNLVMEQTERRKIIVATNIAETSLTIPGVRHVIDSGLARVNRFDAARGFNTLFTESISRDSADQRAGRAGREASGICIRLWSESKQAGLAHHSTPEIHRVDLAETVLSIKQLGYTDCAAFPWFETPPESALGQAVETLQLLGAIDNEGKLTPAGMELSTFPMHPRLARLLLEGSKRNCLHLATFSAALLSERSPLAGKPEYPEEAHTHAIASDFYGQYCLLRKIDKSGFDPSVCARYAVNGSAARNILRTQAYFIDICKKMHMNTHDSGDAPAELARCILLAYPDHLAVRRDKGTLICKLRNGRRGVLHEKSLARSASMIVATDIRETKDVRQEIKTTLSLATEITDEWLLEHFESSWKTETRTEWNPVNKAVEVYELTVCLGVIVYEKVTCGPSAEVSSMLADIILSKNIKPAKWDDTVDDWINRVRYASKKHPDQHFPDFNDDDYSMVIHELCEGEYKLDKVSAKPVLPVLQGMLSAQQYAFLESVAPVSIPLPSGRKLRLVYDASDGVKGRARIQELYGLSTSPKIANEPVRIEVLAPNNRPVQITSDLANFWSMHYPELKKTLARRYPKHEWR
jgi:ATP-dependent helicase HrpB